MVPIRIVLRTDSDSRDLLHLLTSDVGIYSSHVASDLVVLVVVHHVVAYTSTVHTTTRSVLVML